MKEIGLHILEACINSITAEANEIEISIEEKPKIEIFVSDNGKGADKDTLENAFSEGFTSSGGKGIGLFRLKTEAEDAKLFLNENGGCTLWAVFGKNAPMGNLAAVMSTLICTNPKVEFTYKHTCENNVFEFTTWNLRKMFCKEDLSKEWKNVCGYIDKGEEKFYGGAM